MSAARWIAKRIEASAHRALSIGQSCKRKGVGLAAPVAANPFRLAFLFPLLFLGLSPASAPASTTVVRDTRIFEIETGRSGQDIRLTADFLRWNSKDWKFREMRKGVYRLSMPEPWVPSFEYKLVIDGTWQPDPTHPLRSPDGYGSWNSVVEETSFEEDPQLEALPGSLPLQKTSFKVADYEGVERNIVVLSPPGNRIQSGTHSYGDREPRTVTIYFQDGRDYLDLAGISKLLANLALTDPDLPRITGVFITPRNRMEEYGAGSERSIEYGDFLAQRLVPEIESRFQTGGSPERRMLMGASLGGLISFYTGLRHPDVFGKIASQSGSFWWEDGAALEWLTDLPGAGLNQRFFVEVGTYETPDMRKWNRRLNDLGQSLGLDWHYQEFPSTHSWMAWRNRMGLILRTLLNEPDFFSDRP